MNESTIAASVALCVAVLCGCTKPYSPPVFEPVEDGAFLGLIDHAEKEPIKALVVHGICRHTVDWVDDRLERYARSLKMCEENSEPQCVPGAGQPEMIGGADVYRASIVPPGSNEIDFEFVVWSPLTSGLKDRLGYDAEVEHTRADFNRKLKVDLLNECLSDAVIYSGAAGQPIRDAMEDVTCQAFGGRMDGRRVCVPDATGRAEVVLIGESLGSKLIFDAVLRLVLRADAHDDDAADDLRAALGRTQAVYLLANQIPILDLADPASRGGASTDFLATSSLAVFLDLVEQGRADLTLKDLPIDELEVVAFSDPNDLLSYTLIPEKLETPGVEVRVVNVLVSNDWTYLGYAEHPLRAHNDYKINRDVAELIINGNHPGGP